MANCEKLKKKETSLRTFKIQPKQNLVLKHSATNMGFGAKIIFRDSHASPYNERIEDASRVAQIVVLALVVG